MASYTYIAYDSHGAKINGELDADNLEKAKRLLIAQKLKPISISEKKSTNTGISLNKRSVNLDDLEFVTSELALLLKSGVRIDRAIGLLAKNKSRGALSVLLTQMHTDIKRGEGIAAVCSKHPKIFDNLYVSMVKLGEASGTLDRVFAKLSEDLRFRRDLKRSLIQALTYPSVILVVCVSCILFVFNYIVPQMSGLFEGMKNLPFYTQLLLDVSDWVQNYQIYVGIALIGFIAFLYYQRESDKAKFDHLIAKAPLVKKVVVMVERIRFNAAMSMMMNAGISVDKAIELATESVGHSEIRSGLQSAGNAIRKGSGLTESLSKSVIYPDFYVSLLEVGEESGQLSPVFDEIAERSRDDFQSWATKFTSLLEPLLILVMGGIVGGVVVVMLLSIVSVNDISF
ncbi:type II secretion system F family protein [Shewanella aestuarii]|uniref:Type II secretion system F family protein n=1 Tax=Shewanella aestuarii TaxID=1028752 RepID=A0A6G9QL83_9GAMM|nr:type II secretion system F family protein [Shewanella aestuarii]QIR15148.1 type II secretion system F family protein [Shewanella aestuarii]